MTITYKSRNIFPAIKLLEVTENKNYNFLKLLSLKCLIIEFKNGQVKCYLHNET